MGVWGGRGTGKNPIPTSVCPFVYRASFLRAKDVWLRMNFWLWDHETQVRGSFSSGYKWKALFTKTKTKKRRIRTWVVLFSVPLGGISGPICASHILRPSSAPPSTHEIYLPHGSKSLVPPAGVCMGPFHLDFALLFLVEKKLVGRFHSYFITPNIIVRAVTDILNWFDKAVSFFSK